ncbi:hypothetical protein ACGO3R_12580 [Lactococcus lactis]
MKVILRKALPDDYEQIAFVHYKAWLETYTGLLPESFLKTERLNQALIFLKIIFVQIQWLPLLKAKLLVFAVGALFGIVLLKKTLVKFMAYTYSTPIKT